MRQTKLAEYSARPRVTRGHSDLPKEEDRPESDPESESEAPPSSNPPKEKKIHHMTLKAMERKRKLAEQAELLGIPLEKPQPVEKIPKKRGRPKGFKVKKVEDKEDFEINELALEISESPEKKKEIVLRKRDPSKRIVDDNSEMIERDLELIEQEPPREEPKPKEDPAVPPAPKRRGRKKKVVVEAPPLPPPVPAQKVYTVPKTQTYENYLKYYDQIMEEHLPAIEEPLIFDKFLDPEGYQRLLQEIS